MDARDFKGYRIAATMPRGDESHRSIRSRIDHETLWRDLATNLPGSAARAKAIELRRAAPVLTVLARAFDVRTPERDWRIGADGEEAVGRSLQRLGEGWHVIHAVPVGRYGSDMDHVVVGPAGVFSLNTKNHRRSKVQVFGESFCVGDFRTDYVRKSRLEAKRASRCLSAACGFEVEVDPVLVVLASELVVKRRPAGVDVVAHRFIHRWLKRSPTMLSPARVSEIFVHARRDVTWR
jgi:hypothetical protein